MGEGRDAPTPEGTPGAAPRAGASDEALDLARVVACLAVVLLHASARTIYLYNDVSALTWNAANLVNSATRWCVPLFVMLSGALLLRAPVRDPVLFFRRRAARVLIPLAAWSAIYLLWRVVFHKEKVTLKLALNDVFLAQPYFHLYFLYLVVGLYLFTPALAAMVHALPRRHAVASSLGVIVVSALVLAFGQWAPNALTFCVPYVGYFVLGGALAREGFGGASAPGGTSARWAGALAAAVLACAAGTSALYAWLGPTSGWGLYLYNYFSPTTIVAAVAVFVLLGRARVPAGAAPLLRRAAALTLGVYVMHPMVLEVLRRLYGRAAPPLLWPVLDVPVTFVLAAAISAAATAALLRLPGLRRIV